MFKIGQKVKYLREECKIKDKLIKHYGIYPDITWYLLSNGLWVSENCLEAL